jgi:hypothetical protein
MLVDLRHKPWLVGTAAVAAAAVAFYLARAATAPEGLTGGSTVGLWYGVIAAALMGVAALLSVVRRLPVWRRPGRAPAWLRAHLWLGTLSAVFLLCHSGGRCGSVMGRLLWLVAAGVVVTGALGLVLQQVLPRLLAARVPCEAPPGHLSRACRALRRQADDLVDQACGAHDPRAKVAPAARSPGEARRQLRNFYEQEVRPFLGRRPPWGTALADPLRTADLFARLRGTAALGPVQVHLEQLAGLCQERRRLLVQQRLHFLLHAWLLLHVPLSAALLVLVAAHVVAALSY